MAEGSDIGSGAARALDDCRVDLNLTSGAMDVVKLKENMSTGSMQATANTSVMDVMKHETVLFYGSVAPSSTRGSLIYSTPIDPSQFYTGTSPSRVTWMSKLYRFWRGDVKFKFVFTKTILQQVKFLAVFIPNASPTDPPPSPDNAFFYNHKVLMNPANETEWSLDVPYVSDRPFRVMGQETGMLYLMLYHNMAVSNADSSDIFVSIFVSGTSLQFHELVQLPPIAGVNSITPGNSFIIQTFAGAAPNPGNTGTKTFLSDNLTTLATALGTDTDTAAFAVTNGQCIAASPLVNAEVLYNPSTMRTISGSPAGLCVSTRTIICCQANTATGAPFGTVAYLTVYIWPDFSFTISPASASTVCTYQNTAAIAAYNITFPSTFTAVTADTVLTSRVAQLENAIRELLRANNRN
jgi:hypothetical protein